MEIKILQICAEHWPEMYGLDFKLRASGEKQKTGSFCSGALYIYDEMKSY